jgi:hypothetical protein
MMYCCIEVTDDEDVGDVDAAAAAAVLEASDLGVCFGREEEATPLNRMVDCCWQQHDRGCGKEKLGLKKKRELDSTFWWRKDQHIYATFFR